MKPLLHLLAEVLLGLLAIAALAACLLIWRLAQGPLDMTWLIRREPALVSIPGSDLHVGAVAVAWPGGRAALEVTVQDLALAARDGSLRVNLRHARLLLSVPQLLLGRIAPQAIEIDGGDIQARNAGTSDKTGRPADLARLAGSLQHVQVHNIRATYAGAVPGLAIVAQQIDVDLARQAGGGVAGHTQIVLEAGTAHCTVAAQAELRRDGVQVSGTTTSLSPALLAGLAPELAGLSAVDAPVQLTLQATLGRDLALVAARLDIAAGAGTLQAGRGRVKLASLAASVIARPSELRLDSLRMALAPAGAAHGPAPVITASASATRAAGRVHASFGLQIDGFPFADLAQYWPEGVGGGARPWLLENVPAGHAHDAALTGSLDAADDLTGAHLTALTGSMLADDISVFWLRPIPGLAHGRARVSVLDADTMVVTMDRGGQNNLVLTPGSSIRMIGLTKKDQFSDIEVGLSGALPDALGLLNHPRLHLLDSGGFQVDGARGQAVAHLSLHVPLDARVTMEQIGIDATATLSAVHLGHIAAGHDLDDGALKLHVTGDGLSASGTGAVAGIPAVLGVDMDFRAGPPGQLVQHVTASGHATAAQMLAAGAPQEAAGLLQEGSAGLRVDYASLRSGISTLQVDGDLTQAAVQTPLGWSKPAGAAAALGGRATLEKGRLTGIDHLHAEGPGLAIVSHGEIDGTHRTLLLDQLDFGRTKAHGRIGFPAAAGGPLRVDMSGAALDLSSVLSPPSGAKPAGKILDGGPEKPASDKPGQAWDVRLAFDTVALSGGHTLAPFALDAASDGLRILHAHARAGAQGEVSVDITPHSGGRSLAIAAGDAGAALQALGVADNLAGGRLLLNGAFDDTKPGGPLSGTATLTEFNVRSAPAIGRLLQAMTLYGLVDIMHGPGLHFSKMIAPFNWHAQVLHLANARAFSPSLGITAQGDIDLRQRLADITGTVVPAYFFNQLLGDIPVLGKIFSPEKGGGVFAARYSVRGRLSDPKVGVNPLSALTPGFLREGFGLFRRPAAVGK